MSPVKNLRMSAPDVGRIRLGDEKKPNRPGAPLPNLRFTSDDDVALKAIAERYGGEIKDWANGEQTYQMVSGTPKVKVLVRGDSLDVNYEAWAKGGISRRCDSETCLLPSMETGLMAERPCWCLANGMVPGEDADACRFTVRLRLLLPEIPGMGQWTITTHSTIAGSEISAQFSMMAAELGAHFDYVSAELAIVEREIKRPAHPDPKRRKDTFYVPVLRFRQSLEQLAELAGAGAPQIEGGTRPALEAGNVAEVGAPAPPSAPPAAPRDTTITTVSEFMAAARKRLGEDGRATVIQEVCGNGAMTAANVPALVAAMEAAEELF